ncbi:MAG TPA: AsmA-like C-terminal region-containing protein, partial [Steroidobacter sp.]|nr:AsmA-like C-terminal region-containing protein [Steroidobacter sp.]
EVVSDATAEVEFRNQSMRIAASSARIAGLSVGFARAEIPDLKTTELTVRGAAHGDLGAALEFLRDSPVGTALGEQFARLRGSGPLRADVRLDLPIKRMVDRDIEVSAQVQDASARLVGLAAPVHELNGALTVRNTLVAAGRLEGRWLGGPLSISVEPDGRDASILRVQGRTDGGRLAALMSGRAEGQPAGAAFGESGAASPFVQGEADWRASTRLVAADGGASRRRVVHIESDTRGLEVLLPAPLGKEAAEPRNLQVALEFDDHLLARSSFGEVRALIRMQRTPSGALRFDRGGVRADGVAPSLPDHPRLRIEGALDRLALDEWFALRADGSGGRPLSEYLQAANVRVAQLELFGYRFEDVRGVLQATSGGWRVDVASPGAQGQIIVPENLRSGQPLRATLDRLMLRKAPGRENAQPVASDPRRLPALEVYVADLRMGSRNIGAVDLKASRAPQGLHFDSVTIIGDAVRAEARGRWLATSDGPQSWLAARVSSEDVAAALSALDYTPFMEAERGDIRADLTWPGGFDEDLLARASGAISLRVQSGQLVNVQPGAGRMLGLFSVAALPRRLALDFSDLTDKGLTFDSVHGDFELRNGAAYTNNLLLTGPAAEIGIAGRTGLATRDYDQTAVVTGALGASLPVAGALAGGPAVGAALLLFSQVFKEPLKGITRGYYRITGPWEDPTVERIDASAAAGQDAQAPES